MVIKLLSHIRIYLKVNILIRNNAATFNYKWRLRLNLIFVTNLWHINQAN